MNKYVNLYYSQVVISSEAKAEMLVRKLKNRNPYLYHINSFTLKTVLFSIIIACSTFVAHSQKKVEVDVIHLFTDSILKGEIINNIPGNSITLKTLDDRYLFIPINEIDRISTEYLIKTKNDEYFQIWSDSIALTDRSLSVQADIYGIIENKIPKRGGYKYFYEFLSNAPSITDSFYVDKSRRPYYLWEDTYSLQPRYTRKNKKVKGLWGFSDGEQTYILDQGEFFPIAIEENELVFYGFDRVDKSAVLPAYIMTGVIGASVSASAAKSNAHSQKIRYTINSADGTAVYPYAVPFKTSRQKNELIVYRKATNESLQEAKFLVDDDMLYSFEQDSYVLLKYPLSKGIIKLCSGVEFKECMTVRLSPDHPSYVECIYPDDGAVQLILQKQNQGMFDFSKIQNAQDKRGRQLPKAYKF